jgi:hypothetical protein
MKQEPVAWAEITKEYVAVSNEPFENAIPLYATPVHASDMSEKHVHKSDKHRHEDWYGQHQWQCGYERGWDAAMEQKREWVGLEEEEILKCFDSVALGQVVGDCVIDKHVNIFNAIRAIEAKLREKNT